MKHKTDIEPRYLKIGDKFKLRPTNNTRRFVVNGIVLKVCKENGFKNYPSWYEGKIRVPVDADGFMGNELLLEPDKKVYVL